MSARRLARVTAELTEAHDEVERLREQVVRLQAQVELLEAERKPVRRGLASLITPASSA